GALYPALRRLEKKGWIEGDWGESELGRRARFYQLTKKGWMALQKETARWEQHAAAVSSILREVGS
ncbi:MAG: helix-turn-helix transcriptional regulator, partial [Gemmatimonadetes bacterium]|nr:helix-turn-helix transcriptional regulator [Gemmatimonadota bacterium]